MPDPTRAAGSGPTRAHDATPMRWLAFGLDPDWISEHLAPLCDAFSPPLHAIASPGHPAEAAAGALDWTLIFLGGDDIELEELVLRVGASQPLSLIVAVAPSASLGRQLALMRAGAIDTLTLTSNETRVRESLRRAAELCTARRRAVDQDKLTLVNQLAVSVNHEINNPLTGLMGTAELMLLDNKDMDDKTRRDIKMIIQQCRRIQEVTSRLKALNHLRTVPYGSHDRMIDLIGEIGSQPEPKRDPKDEQSDPAMQFLPSPSILVVDDNPLIIDLLARLFDQNYRIEGATSAAEALKKIERRAYELVLIDLILPEMNGLELYREIRKAHPRQKAMLTTAHPGDERVEVAIAEGALCCLSKPFKIDEVERILTDALNSDKG